MKEFIDRAYGLYNTYVKNGSLNDFMETIESFESYSRDLIVKFPNRKIENEFKTLLDKAWKQFTIGKHVYRVSHYTNEVEQILI